MNAHTIGLTPVAGTDTAPGQQVRHETLADLARAWHANEEATAGTEGVGDALQLEKALIETPARSREDVIGLLGVAIADITRMNEYADGHMDISDPSEAIAFAAITAAYRLLTGGPSDSRPDPVFDLIEAHKAACAEVLAAHAVSGRLEKELPPERRRSHLSAWTEGTDWIVETDDPRWIKVENRIEIAFRTSQDAAAAIVNCESQDVTVAGVFAVMQYAAEAMETDSEIWPVDLSGDVRSTEKEMPWSYWLAQWAATHLRRLAAPAMPGSEALSSLAHERVAA